MKIRAKHLIKHIFWPLMPAWPDEGRRVVQNPAIRDMLAHTDRNGTGRVLNAGTGEGGCSSLLLGLPGVRTLVESDISFNGRAVRQIDRRQVFVGASLTAIPLPCSSVDLVLCTEVLEHIADDGQALDELTRVLAPSGWLLITVPTPPAPYDPAHVREGYTAIDLERLLFKRGYQVVEVRYCMHQFFRWMLALWRRLPWTPMLVVQCLSILDRHVPIGKPMDVLILAHRNGHTTHAGD